MIKRTMKAFTAVNQYSTAIEITGNYNLTITAPGRGR